MINILLCGNRGVLDGVITVMLSALMRDKGYKPYRFYIFTMDVSHLDPKYVPIADSDIVFLDRVAKRYGKDNSVIKIDVTPIYREELLGCPNENAYCSPYTLIRLFADIVPNMPDKLLYLDIDLMFNRSAHLIYDLDVEGYEYAAAPDHYGKYLINHGYINAGVILFNMKEIRKTGLLSKAREHLRRKKLTFADQSALIRATTKRKLLRQKFNDQKFLHRHTVIRHFSKRLFYLPYPHTDNIKPWQVDKLHRVFRYNEFDDILTEYQRLKKELEREKTKNGKDNPDFLRG